MTDAKYWHGALTAEHEQMPESGIVSSLKPEARRSARWCGCNLAAVERSTTPGFEEVICGASGSECVVIDE